MPNWCFNDAVISHDDPVMIKRLLDASKTGILQEFLPCPQELLNTVSSIGTEDKELQEKYDANIKKYGEPDWYSWCLANWGTKWDFTAQDYMHLFANQIGITFDSAWSPPIEAYRKLEELGFRIEAKYYEPGLGFAGRYENGEEEYVEYDFSDDNWRESMSDELADMLEPEYENFIMWQEEEEKENN